MSIDTHSFARRWLERRGMFDADSDYDGALGHEVMRLVDALVQYGHSGYSAAATLKLFNDCMVDYSEGTSEEWREYWNTPEARELVMSRTRCSRSRTPSRTACSGSSTSPMDARTAHTWVRARRRRRRTRSSSVRAACFAT
jgi:hypothetical protein